MGRSPAPAVAWSSAPRNEFPLLEIPTWVACGEDGSFELTDVPPGRITLSDDSETTKLDLELAPGETRKSVVLDVPPPKER